MKGLLQSAPFVVSVALHGAAFAWLARAERPAVVHNEAVQVAVVEKPPPPPPAPEPPKPEPARPREPARPKPPPPAPTPPPDAPPPPSTEAPKPTPAPVVITGITLESTTTGGTFALPVGNTLYGRVADTAAPPEEVKPYRADAYALPPPAPPPDEPALPVGVADLDLRSYYPDEAKRAGVEGDVVLRVTVEPDGTVSRTDVFSHPGFGLDDAARRALRERIRWRPAKRRGEPVRMTVPFTLHFELY